MRVPRGREAAAQTAAGAAGAEGAAGAAQGAGAEGSAAAGGDAVRAEDGAGAGDVPHQSKGSGGVEHAGKGSRRGSMERGSVAFGPRLPGSVLRAVSSLGWGEATKVALRFPYVFWPRDAHFLGKVTLTQT